jgi:hypothetical protein
MVCDLRRYGNFCHCTYVVFARKKLLQQKVTDPIACKGYMLHGKAMLLSPLLLLMMAYVIPITPLFNADMFNIYFVYFV